MDNQKNKVHNGWTINRNEVLSDSEKREDAKIASAVVAKVNQMKNQGIPVAVYDGKTGKAYLEQSDNS